MDAPDVMFSDDESEKQPQQPKSRWSRFMRRDKKESLGKTGHNTETFPSQSEASAPEYRESDQLTPIVENNAFIISPLLTIMCFFFLLWMFAMNDWKMESMADNPSAGVSVETMVECGAKDYDKIVYDEQWWRLLTAAFLHAGIIHFLVNMIALLAIGYMLETVFGFTKVFIVYIVSGVFSTIVSTIFLPDQIMVGASGAIFGLVGSLWADLIQNWKVKTNRCYTFFVLFIVTAVNIVLGLMPYLDNFAHIGGLVMGFFVSLPLFVLRAKNSNGNEVKTALWQYALKLLGLAAALLLFIGSLVILYSSMGLTSEEWCSWCKGLSCVEFPPGDNPLWRCDECTMSGFEILTTTEDVVVKLVCPEGNEVDVDTCDTSSKSALITCFINMCL